MSATAALTTADDGADGALLKGGSRTARTPLELLDRTKDKIPGDSAPSSAGRKAIRRRRLRLLMDKDRSCGALRTAQQHHRIWWCQICALKHSGGEFGDELSGLCRIYQNRPQFDAVQGPRPSGNRPMRMRMIEKRHRRLHICGR